MSGAEQRPEHALVLAPSGRDGGIAAEILNGAGLKATICADLPNLLAYIEAGAGLAVIADEALRNSDLAPLAGWVDRQPSWSDFPFLLLTQRGGSVERNPAAQRLSSALGNVSFLERPFHPTTLVSSARTAVRARRRQYDSRELIVRIRQDEALLERRVAERTAELEAANRQLAAQIVERERAESALHQAQRLEAVGQLTSGVAHDFNNLLTVVIGNIDQMQKRISDPTLIRRLSMMSEASRRGAKLTAQMLAFSRRQKLEPRPVDLNETVRGMRDLLQSTIGVSIEILEPELADGLWPAMIDPTQIELVILNLAINARDAMEEGGTLLIRTENVETDASTSPEAPPAGRFATVSVTDTGSGMSAEVLARAFEPFFTTKAVGKGSGLGLSQVFGVAKQSGGGVSIQTELGEGTTIKIFLPRADAPPAYEVSAHAPLIQAPSEFVSVLVVDDDAAVREVTANYLRDLGYQVLEAGSGGAALEVFEQQPAISAAVLDFAMPGLNGAELAREMRSRRPSLPVLFTTGYADAQALAATSDDHLIRKPYDQAELAAKLSRMLGVER